MASYWRLGALVLALGVVAGCAEESASKAPSRENIGDGDSNAACGSAETSVRFDVDIQADIDRQGCSTSSCHGAGLGGMQLTSAAKGSELAANYDAFSQRAKADEASLVLVKATGGAGHVGGVRFAKTDPTYARWLGWIRECRPR